MRTGIVCAPLLLLGCLGPATVDETSSDCSASSVDRFAIGFEKVGDAGNIDFKLVAAEPEQPASGDNNWTIQLFGTTTGTPVTDAAMEAQTIPYLTHPLADRVPLTALATPGRFLLVPQLWKPGIWDTTISVGKATTDTVVFRFCVAN